MVEQGMWHNRCQTKGLARARSPLRRGGAAGEHVANRCQSGTEAPSEEGGAAGVHVVEQHVAQVSVKRGSGGRACGTTGVKVGQLKDTRQESPPKRGAPGEDVVEQGMWHNRCQSGTAKRHAPGVPSEEGSAKRVLYCKCNPHIT